MSRARKTEHFVMGPKDAAKAVELLHRKIVSMVGNSSGDFLQERPSLKHLSGN
jgi:hypothetical protein